MQRSVARLPDFLFALKRSFVRCCLRFLQQLGCVFPVLCYNKRRQLESEFDGLYRPSCPLLGSWTPEGRPGGCTDKKFYRSFGTIANPQQPPVSLADLWKWRWTRCPIACTAIGYLPQRSLIIRTVPGLPTILPILLARMDGL